MIGRIEHIRVRRETLVGRRRWYARVLHDGVVRVGDPIASLDLRA